MAYATCVSNGFYDPCCSAIDTTHMAVNARKTDGVDECAGALTVFND